MEPFLGQISVFGFNFAPVRWALCQGQIVSISQNTALFSLLGTSFGGNGSSTFGLPNMMGSVAIGKGQFPGGSDYALGDTGGSSTLALSRPESPTHTHDLMTTITVADKKGAAGNVMARPVVDSTPKATVGKLYNPNPLDTTLNAPISQVGNGIPHDNVQPYLVLNYCICVSGIFHHGADRTAITAEEQTMSDPFLGQVEIFGFNFPPRNWMKCAGQTLAITTNQALFSLLGTTYGGNGVTTFGLPDLRGRVAVGAGFNWTQGQLGGTESVKLTQAQLAAHVHTVMAASSTDVTKDTEFPSATVELGQTDGVDEQGNPLVVFAYVADTNPAATLHATAVSTVGAGAPHENRMPLLALNPCICIAGLFPSRS